MAKLFQTLAAVTVFLPAVVTADLATVHLADGRSMTVDLVIVDRGQIQWKNPANPAEQMQTFLRSQIDYVDFPPTGLWKSAEADFQSGNITSAIEGYQAVVADREAHYYPMPGNFVSLALVRLLEIRRTQLNADAVAAQFQKVRSEWLNLPPEYRTLDPVTAAWIAMSGEKWQDVLDHLDKVESPGPETYYLRGRAAEALGRPEEAIQHYAGAYVLNFGGFAGITKQSLRRSIDLLAAADDKNRRSELQAQAKLYRDLFGKGKLWEGAPAQVVELAEAEIETAKADIDGAEMEKPTDDTGTVVETGTAAAAMPAKDERDWLLPSEIDEKVFIVGRSADDTGIENRGGVKKTTDGYAFDGTGPGLSLQGIDGQAVAWIIKAEFVPQEKDGAFFDLAEGGEGGFGFYLRDGKFVAVWRSRESEKVEVDSGMIELGKPNTLYFRVTETGELRVRLNESDPIDATVPEGGLNLEPLVGACLGDTRSHDEDTYTADGDEYTPFKGSVSLFDIGSGADPQTIAEVEKEMFGGKRIVVRPPAETPAPPKPEAKPTAKPQTPAQRRAAARAKAAADAKKKAEAKKEADAKAKGEAKTPE